MAQVIRGHQYLPLSQEPPSKLAEKPNKDKGGGDEVTENHGTQKMPSPKCHYGLTALQLPRGVIHEVALNDEEHPWLEPVIIPVPNGKGGWDLRTGRG